MDTVGILIAGSSPNCVNIQKVPIQSMHMISISYTVLRNSNIPVEHTPDPDPPLYEGNPFILDFFHIWGMFQGCVGLFFENGPRADRYR